MTNAANVSATSSQYMTPSARHAFLIAHVHVPHLHVWYLAADWLMQQKAAMRRLFAADARSTPCDLRILMIPV